MKPAQPPQSQAPTAHADPDEHGSSALPVYERVVPARPGSIGRIRWELDAALSALGVSARRREDVALAVTEAVTNAVLHAYVDRRGGPVAVSAELNDGTVLVRVGDRGRGMRPRADSPGLGLGLVIMRRLADAVAIAPAADECGTRVSMAFRRATDAADAAACGDARGLRTGARQAVARGGSRRRKRKDARRPATGG